LKKVKGVTIDESEINQFETLESYLNFCENNSPEDFGDDEYPFPQVFILEAFAIRTLLANPNYTGERDIKKLHHIFSEDLGDDKPSAREAIYNINVEGVEPIFKFAFEYNYHNYYYININGKQAIYYEGSDGYSSTIFSFSGIIA